MVTIADASSPTCQWSFRFALGMSPPSTVDQEYAASPKRTSAAARERFPFLRLRATLRRVAAFGRFVDDARDSLVRLAGREGESHEEMRFADDRAGRGRARAAGE